MSPKSIISSLAEVAMRRFCRFLAVAVLVTAGGASSVRAQSTPPSLRMVDVDGGPMRVWAAGLERRQSGQPVVILEAGGGEGLDNWTPVFAQIARIAPVVAYDRKGIGQSAPDSVKLTLRRVAQSLHALLQRMNISPPYVLVGHSWGGLLSRAYIDQYATEVIGLVLLEAVNPGIARKEEAQTVPPEELPAIPPDTPAGLRAEMELILAEMGSEFREARSLQAPTGIPIVVVSAMPPARLKNRISEGRGIDLAPHEQAGLALSSPKGMFVAASHVGHMVHRDDPELVVRLIEHVLKHAQPAK